MQSILKTLLTNRSSIQIISTTPVELEIRLIQKRLNRTRCKELFESFKEEQQYSVISTHIKGQHKTVRTMTKNNKQTSEVKTIVFRSICDDFIASCAIEDRCDTIINAGKIRVYVRRSCMFLNNKVRIDMSLIDNKIWDVEFELMESFKNIHIDEFIKLYDKIKLMLYTQAFIVGDIPPNICSPLSFESNYIVGYPKPHDVYIHHILNIYKDSNITGKVDGNRLFVTVFNKKMSLILPNKDCILSITVSDPSEYIIDAELYNNFIFPIDIIYHSKVDVKTMIFSERLRLLNFMFQPIKILLKYIFVMKPSYNINSYEELASTILKLENQYSTIPIDGFIITPLKSKYGDISYKWKYRPTIDVVYNNGVLFTSSNIKIGQIPIEHNIKQISIVEVYKDGDFKFLREREDKETPNSDKNINTYINAYEHKSILNRDGILGYNSQLLRFSHNCIKRDILKTLNGPLLDIGSGKGGDIRKWKHINKIYAIEPNKTRYSEMIRRAGKTSNIKFINKLAQNLHIPRDIKHITMFFCVNQIGIANLNVFIDKVYNIKSLETIHVTHMDTESITSDINLKCATIKSNKNTVITTVKESEINELEENRMTKDQLIQVFKDKGFDIVSSTNLLDKSNNLPMSKDQQYFTSLYYYSVFSK